MGIEFLQNHIALASSNEISNICAPLSKLGINYFSFVRSFKDGSHVRLSNNPAWTQHYYLRGFYNIVIKQIPDLEGNILWSCIDKFPLFHEASEYFNVDNGTVMIVTIDDIVERYFFGSTRENKQVNYIYLNQTDLLKKFILYFKETAKKIIDLSEKSKIIIPRNEPEKKDEQFYCDSLIEEFLNEIKVNKVCIRAYGKDIYISSNEAKILSLMKFGCTAKEISKVIGLKRKTIEIYRDKLKSKLDQYTRGNLTSLANSNSLLDINLLK